MRWTSSGRRNDDASTVSTRSDLSTLSGLVASRGLSVVEHRDKLVSSQVDATDESRLSQSFGDPMRKQEKMPIANASQLPGRINMKEATMDGHGHKERKNHFSGPLPAPSSNIEQDLEDLDVDMNLGGGGEVPRDPTDETDELLAEGEATLNEEQATEQQSAEEERCRAKTEKHKADVTVAFKSWEQLWIA
ncbi:hypothetical protein ACS0TY_018442 [Phlomoides rotata]